MRLLFVNVTKPTRLDSTDWLFSTARSYIISRVLYCTDQKADKLKKISLSGASKDSAIIWSSRSTPQYKMRRMQENNGSAYQTHIDISKTYRHFRSYKNVYIFWIYIIRKFTMFMYLGSISLISFAYNVFWTKFFTQALRLQSPRETQHSFCRRKNKNVVLVNK